MKKLVLPLILLFALHSCSSDEVYNSYVALENHAWYSDSTQTYEFEITDTTHYYNLNFLVRIDESYRFSNLYILYTMKGPSGRTKTVRQNFTVADKSGKWLGKGYSNIFSYDEVIMKEIKFTSTGKYSIDIGQHMRVDELNGVHDVGLKVTKGEEVF